MTLHVIASREAAKQSPNDWDDCLIYASTAFAWRLTPLSAKDTQ